NIVEGNKYEFMSLRGGGGDKKIKGSSCDPFFSARNLLPVNKKNHRYQRWFVCRNLELPTLSSEGNWL
ncbi:hypothetical protein LVK52_26905, partial [Escherichia coli]|uniref:hypothetical protein n=1 Tax=Escherichia coli TaxID=562 RepID=UPI00263DAF2E